MIGNKKVLAITLARGGSKAIPLKNIIPLAGKPLIQYTIDEVKQSKYIDSYFVSTDDERIKTVCNKSNTKIVNRSAENSSDTASSAAALIESIERIGGDYDIIVEVMCTNPMKISSDIDACIEMLSYCKCDSVVSVSKLAEHHPSRIKFIEDGYLKNFYPEIPESRRQDLTPDAYIRNGSIYAVNKNFLLKNRMRYNNETTMAYIMPDERCINIDTKEDYLMAEILMIQKIKNKNG